MEEVLDRPVRNECKLTRNDRGLYDLLIRNADGMVAMDIKNITFRRAVTIIENNMYQYRRAGDV